MEKYDLLIRDGYIVTPNDCQKGSIAISSGKIAAILPECTAIEAKHEIDATERYVMPGAIDTHSHFFEPGAEYREGFFHGTQAAASGGYATVMDMPNTEPPVSDIESFNLKYQRACKSSFIDFVIWGASLPNNIKNINELYKLGCPAFKAFTLDAGPTFQYSDSMNLYLGMKEVREVGGVFAVHAEDDSIVSYFREENGDFPWSPILHDQSRPYYAELTAINTALILAKVTGCPLHICHMSIPEGAELIKLARMAGGVDVTVETCPHYLVLNTENIINKGTYGMICPPIRNKERMEQLWNYIEDGTIDYIGTDHAPYTIEDKNPADGNLWNAAAGAPSIDIAVPLILTHAVKKRGISISRVAKLLSTNAAKRFGLYPRKGAISIGADADIMIVDMDKNWIYSRANSLSKTKATDFAYEGTELNCYVETTIVRGEIVYSEGKIIGAPGYGKLIKKCER